MFLQISGKQTDVEDGITVSRLMELQKVVSPQYVTVAVNNAFLPAEQHADYRLHEGDTVEFLYFMGGGSDGAEQ